MADGSFNEAKGKVVQLVQDTPAKFGVLLLKVSEADATLEDYATVADILAGANTRADFTNYVDKTALTATRVIDNTNNWTDVSMADVTWASAGGALNNTMTKAIVFVDLNAGADADLMPISHHDFTPLTDGNSLILQISPPGFYREQ